MCFNCKNHLEKQLALFEQGNALMNSIDSLIYAMYTTNCLYVYMGGAHKTPFDIH